MSRHDEELGHGLFTWTFLEGLRDGKADALGDGAITIRELDAYIYGRLPKLAAECDKQLQIPRNHVRGDDFPLGVVGN